MDPLFLSRFQFAAATLFHFLFVPLTLGLSVLLAVMETRWARTGDEIWRSMTKFWGKLFLINFALGVVTGITLEFQFGTNWSRYSAYVGDIFGSLLAIEATTAFFLESTLLGVWVFGWNKLSRKAHATVMWLIAFASTLSAVWILIANAWMQHPVGYTIRNGRAELTDFLAVITQPSAVMQFIHTVGGAYILSAFFVMGISAWYLLKKRHTEIFTHSFRIALVFGLIFALVTAGAGHIQGLHVGAQQPAKLAAMESHWETVKGAPMYLFVIPDEKNEKNLIEIAPIPGLLSFLAFNDPKAEVKGLADFPKEDRPPVAIPFLSFRIMVALGGYFVLVTLYGWMKRNRLMESPGYLKLMVWSIPLPYIALEVGWMLAEVGRQPWIVYGLMRTSDAFSPVAGSQVFASLIGFVLIYGLLGAAGTYLMVRHVKKGPAA